MAALGRLLGGSWAALGRLLGVCWAPQRPRRGPGGARRPQRDGQEAPRASPGQTACTTAAGRENDSAQRARENERAQRARDGLTRDHGNARDLPRDHHTTIPRETYLYRDTTRPRKTREIYHETTRPRTPRQMYLFRRSTGARKTREIYRWATRQTRQPRRPTDAPTAFSDSAFRFLSRQVTESGRSARLELHWYRYAMNKRECRGRSGRGCKRYLG